MIRGKFSLEGRPYIDGHISILRLGIERAPISLLFDTGADSTCIHPYDAQAIGVPIWSLTPNARGAGIGGVVEYATFEATVELPHDKRFWQKSLTSIFHVNLRVAIPSRGNWRLPSILGRDVIDRCRVRYDLHGNRLECRPRFADGVAKL